MKNRNRIQNNVNPIAKIYTENYSCETSLYYKSIIFSTVSRWLPQFVCYMQFTVDRLVICLMVYQHTKESVPQFGVSATV